MRQTLKELYEEAMDLYYKTGLTLYAERASILKKQLACKDHDPNDGPGSDYCINCKTYAVA